MAAPPLTFSSRRQPLRQASSPSSGSKLTAALSTKPEANGSTTSLSSRRTTMDTRTSTGSSPSLGEITTIIQQCLAKACEIIRQVLSSYLAALEASLRAISSAARAYPSLQAVAAMTGLGPDASSATLPLYLGTITTSKSSPSGNLRRLASSTPLMNVYPERQASLLS